METEILQVGLYFDMGVGEGHIFSHYDSCDRIITSTSL